MSRKLRQPCEGECCACQEACECEEIGFQVGFALYPPSHPRGGTPRPDPDASLCCRALRPGFWWNAPPTSLTGQLVGAEFLVYEVWAEAADVASSHLLCPSGDGTPEYLPNRCTLHHLVLVADHPTATGQPGAAGALTEGPTATRAQWYGTTDLDGCCRRWPNFFLKVIARAGFSSRTLAVCRASWGGAQGSELCNRVPETGSSPCFCGIFEERPGCPDNDGIASVSLTITSSDGGSFGPGAMTRGAGGTEGCSCPGGSWRGDFGFCGLNHTAILCLGLTGRYFLSVFVNSSLADPDEGFSGFGVGGGCGAPSIETFSGGVGVFSLCSFEEGTTFEAIVSFESV